MAAWSSPVTRFSIQDVETASLLVDHAVVALENARLHQVVERQALLDGLMSGTDAEVAAQVAERIRETLAQTAILSPGAEPLRVTAGFGAAASPLLSSADGIVAAADAALYDAKRSGKDTVVTARAPAEPVRFGTARA
jgi:diguanylate cyclase (GGDEF)-like protein